MKKTLLNLRLHFSILTIVTIAVVSNTVGQSTWRGISTNWNAAGSWLPSGVPTATTDVIIPVIAGNPPKYPILTAAATCRSISMDNGTSISGSGTLTINSSVTTAGTNNSATISCPITLPGTTTFTPLLGSTLNIGGAISGAGGVIKSGQGNLLLQTNPSGSFSSLIINDGNFNLSNSVTLTVAGLITLTDGTLNFSSGSLVANGGITRGVSGIGNLASGPSSNLTLGGATGAETLYFDPNVSSLNNLELAHSATATTTLFTSISIYGGVIFGSSFDVLDLNGQPVTLISDFNATAYIGEIKGTLNNASNVTVERYIDGTLDFTYKRSWRLLTIPVTGQTIRQAWAGANANANAPTGETHNWNGTLITGHGFASGAAAATAGFDWFTGLTSTTTSSIRFYNSTSNNWPSTTNTPSTLSAPSEQGYMLYVRGDRTIANSTSFDYTTLRPTGTIKQSQQLAPVNTTYSVIGNPYPSAIDLDALYGNTGNAGKILRKFWVWDATQGTSGAYVSIAHNGTAYVTTGGDGISNYLVANSGQAFFVEKNGSGGSITIEESNKTAEVGPVLFRPVGNTVNGGGVSNLLIKLYQATGTTLGLRTDAVRAQYNDLYNESPIEIYDVVKLNNFNENLSLVRNNNYLTVESRPMPLQNDTLYMPFWNLKSQGYALQIISGNFKGVNQTAVLIDAFTNTESIIGLNDDTTLYPFSITSDAASFSLNRFKIVMRPFVVLPVNCTQFNASLIAGKVRLTWVTSCETGASNFVVEKSTSGSNFIKMDSVIARSAITGANYQLLDPSPNSGKNYYRIRSNTLDGKFTLSNIAFIQLNGKQSMQVMPTVINNGQFTLNLIKQVAGNYKLSLITNSGQQVYNGIVTNAGGNSSHLIDLTKAALPAGIYHLSVTDENGAKQNFKLLINP